ncbi:zinc ribbon domain-containing protein [bacterium]|nr:zinc ribbon domain-containing protein [bacterium]MBU1074197.1 zinc ribbon domain-containing protein [bacterium]MBU1674811.1 zinc ribbon domain-containing protein [bacterium]
MPTYEYECTKCGHGFELLQSIHDRPRRRCPLCRGKVEKLISGGIGISFKGAGFYATDSRRTVEKEKKEKKATDTNADA